MKKTTSLILSLTVIVISAYLIYRTYPDVHPLGAIKLGYNSAEITIKGENLIDRLNLSAENKTETTTLQPNRALIKSLYDKFSFREANKLLRDKIPGYYWAIEWKKPEEKIVFNEDESRPNIISAGDIILNYDAEGNLLKFRREIKDSVKFISVPEETARQLALNFLNDYSPVNPEKGTSVNRYKTTGSFSEIDLQKIQRQMRTEYEFSWKAGSADIDKNLIVRVTVSGDFVSEFTLSFDVPENVAAGSSSIFSVATGVPFYIIVYILLIIIGYKRIRAYEVSFRLAIIMGLIAGITYSIQLYTLIADTLKGWELWTPLIFLPIFLAAGVLLSWAVSEILARETWKQKFVSLDLITKGYAFHSKVGSAGIAGIAGGFLLYLIWMGILLVSEQVVHISFVTKNSSDLISHFYSLSPWLNIVNNSIYHQIYTVAIFFLFLYSGLKRRFSSLYVLIPISAILWGIINYDGLLPLYWGIITGIIMGVLFMLFFNYYDVLASIITLIVFNITSVGVSLFTSGNNYYVNSGYYLIALIILSVVFLIIGLYTNDKIIDFESITPAFVKNITERQRLQRELEIARDVQMSFLPAKNPKFSGLDIAAKCIPALEVGGDYYDFVKLDDKRLGIIIGDVSGKGTQAAFYMTLAKGFVKALSKTVNSPAEFLIKFNELFYENVERGTFISMIYGIIDVNKKTLTFARAGHNPVIAKHSGKNEVELLNPVGLAIGLEKGTIFSRTIKEINVDMQSGDMFVFYTDGFTEAMNKYKMEYTEERLTELISQNTELPPEELLEKTIAGVKSFMGKALQHDDMTMVVVKVIS